MKRILLFYLSVLACSSLSCQKTDSTSASFFETIANDPVYIEYHIAEYENMALIAQKAWDLDGVPALFRKLEAKYGEEFDICAIPPHEFDGLRGGRIKQESNCKVQTAAEVLSNKYNYFQLPEEQINEIRKIFLANGGAKYKEEARKKALEYLTRPTGPKN